MVWYEMTHLDGMIRHGMIHGMTHGGGGGGDDDDDNDDT